MRDDRPPGDGGITTELLADGPDGIARAAALLRAGRLVAFGTETVYGLGADATDPGAVAAIFAAKGRPAGNPLIAHVADAEAAFAQVEATALALRVADAFWPGPLTLVLRRRTDCTVCLPAGAGLETLAMRVPDAPVARALLRAVGRPIAAPSANRSGRVSPSTAEHVLAGLGGRVDAVLDSGPCRVGLESTILDLSGEAPRLLRPGGVTLEALEAVIGRVVSEPVVSAAPGADGWLGAPSVDGRLGAPSADRQRGAPSADRQRGAPSADRQRGAPSAPGQFGAPSAPGQFASHYAPLLPLRLDADRVAGSEALLAFGVPIEGAGLVWRLSDRGDLGEAASRLFSGLRALDADGQRLGLSGIAAMPIPAHGLGLAIRDRLTRAAAPRWEPVE